MATENGTVPLAAGSSFGLNHDSWGRLVLIDSTGRPHIGVEPVRAFPISDPQHWISIVDAEGRELVLVEDAGSLPAAVRDVLLEDLARREFVPHIDRILKVSTDAEPSEWDVQTDRGPTKFLLNSGDDIRRLSPYSALVIDVHGTRYLIEDTRKLDAASRRHLERYL
jgi:hypothetical protein